MIMLLLTILCLMVFFCATAFVNARYCFKFLARRFYTVDELTPEFREKFAEQLAQCALPCKRLRESRVSGLLQGPDNRPIIYAAGEIYINESICMPFSNEGFLAGLLYEEAHYKTGFYVYSELIMFIIFAGCLPFVALLNALLQPLLETGHSWMITRIFAYVVNFFHTWPLLQLGIAGGSMIFLELLLGASVVNCYAESGHDLERLLKYLRYVESYITPGLNQCFNVTSNRKRCEKLIEEQERE